MLVLLALLEQVAAQKDRSRRLECRAHAYEYCLLAREMETSIPSTMMAQIHMANHYFHTWKIIIRGGGSSQDEAVRMLIIDPWQIELEGDAKELDIRVTDPIKIGTALFMVKNVTTLDSSNTVLGSRERILITLAGKRPLDGSMIGMRSDETLSVKVEVKQYGLVHTLATDVMKKTTVMAVKAESIYIIGRLFHAQNNIASAIEYYKVAYRICPDLALAVFGHAQIMLSKQELGLSLELFEKVLAMHPDDRDTQAYVMLVRALHKRENSSLEKVREVATGFVHEVDLWLLQGQLRQTTPTEYVSALKCYSHALDCMEQQSKGGIEVDRLSNSFVMEHPRVLSNMAVLHHSLGRSTIALDFCRRALVAQQVLSDSEENADIDTVAKVSRVENPIFKNQLFDGVFYSWSESLCTLKPTWTKWQDGGDTGLSPYCIFEVDTDKDHQSIDLTTIFSPGNELLLQVVGGREELPVLHTVVSVTSTGIVTRSHIHRVLLLTASGLGSIPMKLSVRRKTPGHNFTDSSITMCYNYARILEDLGNTNAAKEVYVQLLKQHPSFIDCKKLLFFRCIFGISLSEIFDLTLITSITYPQATFDLAVLPAMLADWMRPPFGYQEP